MIRLALRALVLGSILSLALVAAAPVPAAPPASDRYPVTPLASDIPGVAPTTDANLVNGWGLARSATSPWWVADNGTDKTTIYNSAGTLQMIGGQPFQTVEGAPTGAVFSGIAGQFLVGTTASPTTLVTVPNTTGAIYKGLAISNGTAGPRLYATDFHNGLVDVFNGSWNRVND